MHRAANGLIREDRRIEVVGRHLSTRLLLNDRPPKHDRSVLVFLHEALGCIDFWGDFPSQLAHPTGLDVLLYDRLGHGASDPLTVQGLDLQYQDPEYQQYLPAVLEHFDVRRCVLIGHSDGGTLALRYAAQNPERVAAIVTEAAHVFVDPLTIAGIRHTVGILDSTDGLRRKLAAAHGVQKAEALVRRWSETWLAPEFSGWNVEACLAKIHCPVLVLQGADDEYGLPVQAETIARQVAGPCEMHLIPDCRHVPHHQARNTVIERILNFLAAQGLIEKEKLVL
jgi:pimeloyl-ACP methyl ester carboxylesterase